MPTKKQKLSTLMNIVYRTYLSSFRKKTRRMTQRVKLQYWNIVSDFCGTRFAIDAFALVSSVASLRSEVGPTQTLALAFDVEALLKRIELRYASFDLVFYARSTRFDCRAVCLHLQRNCKRKRVFVCKSVFEYKEYLDRELPAFLLTEEDQLYHVTLSYGVPVVLVNGLECRGAAIYAHVVTAKGVQQCANRGERVTAAQAAFSSSLAGTTLNEQRCGLLRAAVSDGSYESTFIDALYATRCVHKCRPAIALV
jgi:hypothetical protein